MGLRLATATATFVSLRFPLEKDPAFHLLNNKSAFEGFVESGIVSVPRTLSELFLTCNYVPAVIDSRSAAFERYLMLGRTRGASCSLLAVAVYSFRSRSVLFNLVERRLLF